MRVVARRSVWRRPMTGSVTDPDLSGGLNPRATRKFRKMTYADRRPKEIKNREYRVGVTPESVAEVVHHGRKVLVETKAGSGIAGVDDRIPQPR